MVGISSRRRAVITFGILAFVGVGVVICDKIGRSSVDTAFRNRRAVLAEVGNWMMREGTALPRAIYVDADGVPTVGWRLKLVADCLPTEEHFAADVAWNSPQYERIRKRGIGWVARRMSSSPLMIAIIGEGTPFNGSAEVLSDDVPHDNILFVEVLRDELHWAQPVDIEVSELHRRLSNPVPEWIRSELGHGFHVVFADEQVWFLASDTPTSSLIRFADMSLANLRNREKELGQYRIWSSVSVGVH